ncbi:glucan endo-1,6-beta-glucosidase [Crepidotus variabilis]|uniref:Glucan endo-1,6-beta-glucosidase n=1 Tax=Crepidotus variabilis TaxID=179855 RepID=A0A9P6JMW0_9AGAR|nr:glucan endo-1,6-beta-glucosidase [Crepidotus variabilis]
MRGATLATVLALCSMVESQKIWDIWQTTWNKNKLFSSLAPNPPLDFVAPGAIGDADILVDENTKYQTIVGFGGSLTDSSAQLMSNMKSVNPSNYWSLLNYLFNATEGANAAGLSYLRFPIGACDFSPKQYSYNDVSGDTGMKNVDANAAPSYTFSVLADILAVNPAIKIHVVPWSPPGWMKDSWTMNGGSLRSEMIDVYPTYLFRALQSLRSKGIEVYAVSIQNEPQYSNPTYPTASFTPSTEARIGIQLKSLMKSNGFPNVKLVGYDHNWDGAPGYATQLMQAGGDAFDGVSFHCYGGSVSQQGDFSRQYPNKEIYFTECSGTYGSDWWQDIKWYLDNIFIGSVERNAKAALMWNLALDPQGNPKYPGTSSCGGPGCRGIVTIGWDGTWSVNQEFYAMSHVSKATIPRDIGGPSGQRMKVNVGGSLSWALRVGAFVTGRLNSADWLRYSLVVLNWNDSTGGWNPQPVKATIEFRGMQAAYTFPVGVSTLWWYGE